MSKFCTSCGKEIAEGIAFCTECGTKVTESPEAPSAAVAQPDIPAAQPDIPAAQPDAPATQPDAPAAQPDAPATQPDVPAAPPAAPQYTPPIAPQAPSAAPQYTPPPKPAVATPPQQAEKLSKTVGVAAYIGMMLLFNLPILGFFICIIFACTSRNKSIKNYAKAVVIWTIVCIILVGILIVSLFILAKSFIDKIKDAIEEEFSSAKAMLVPVYKGELRPVPLCAVNSFI